LWHDRDRAGADGKAMARSHAVGLKAKFADLQAMAPTLEHLAEHCAAAEQRSQSHNPRFGVDTPSSSRNRTATVTLSVK
jgi:MerR family transcriptional regulator, copper efflux regulator